MTVSGFLLLVLAGVGTGLVGYLTGLASIVSYPALLAAGLSPVAANVTNTLGVAAIGVGSSARSLPVLLERGRRRFGVLLALGAVGGLVGGGLLLWLGEGAFRLVVPWLIAIGSLLVLLGPRLRAMQASAWPAWAYWLGVAVVAVYCGYFGAGAGTIFLALALLSGHESFERAMGLKSAMLSTANVVASVLFALFGPVDWWAALALGIGCLAGGNLGLLVQRLVPVPVMRWVVAVAGFGLAAWLLVG